MCLILFSWQADPRYRLVVAANRDEYFERPTAPASFWEDHPDLLAGRDLRSGGTWLGVTRAGRVAAVTNYRDPAKIRVGAASRGDLVREFLVGDETPASHAARVHERGADYNPFSLLVADGSEMWFCSNESERPRRVEPGIHGLSNHLLDTSWPKVERGRGRLAELLAATDGVELEEGLFAVLADRGRAPDPSLPSTGVGVERERILSPAFIATRDYGTRCSTVLRIDRQGELSFTEKTFDASGETTHTGTFGLRLSD